MSFLTTPLSRENITRHVKHFLNDTNMYQQVFDDEQVEKCSQYCLSKWEKEGFSEGDIVPAIRQKRFTLSHLKGYSIGAALRRFCGDSLEKIFAPLFWREARRVRQDEKLMRKAVRLKRRQGIRIVLDYLLHGFFVHDARLAEQRQRRQVERIEQRIRRRLRDEDRSDKSS